MRHRRWPSLHDTVCRTLRCPYALPKTSGLGKLLPSDMIPLMIWKSTEMMDEEASNLGIVEGYTMEHDLMMKGRATTEIEAIEGHCLSVQ